MTKSGIASVAHSALTKMTMAKQFCCSGFSMIGTTSSTTKTAMQATKVQKVLLTSHCGHLYFPIGVTTSFMSGAFSSPCLRTRPALTSRPSNVCVMPMFAACAFLSIPIISLHTVLRSHTTCSRRCNLNSRLASATCRRSEPSSSSATPACSPNRWCDPGSSTGTA